MAIARSQLLKELEPGLNALFGLEYDRYDNEHAEIYDTETSDRAFEEEVMLAGFGTAPEKAEGAAVSFDTANCVVWVCDRLVFCSDSNKPFSFWAKTHNAWSRTISFRVWNNFIRSIFHYRDT